MKAMFNSAIDWVSKKLTESTGIQRQQTDPFFLIFLGFKWDEGCLLRVLLPELVGLILVHAWWRQPLTWQLTNSLHCQLTVSNDNHTVQCLAAGYRCQPFFSTGGYVEPEKSGLSLFGSLTASPNDITTSTTTAKKTHSNSKPTNSHAPIASACITGSTTAPLTRGRYFFRYRIDFARPSTTMEIGVCDARIFADHFSKQDNDCSNLSIRDHQQAFLYSWNGGLGRLFGKIASGECRGGYMPMQQMVMELDLRRAEPEHRQLLFYRASDDWEETFSPYLQDQRLERDEVHVLSRYWDLPESVVPIAYLLGSGYDTMVTLIDVVALI
jgi:hypothetical protein